MSQNKEYSVFGRQVGYVIAANVVTFLLGFISIPVLTKGLGASLYGTWSLINVTVSLLVPFAALTFGTSIIRFLAAEKDADKVKDDFFSAGATVFISGSIFSLLLFFLSDYLAESVFKDAGASSYIKLGSVLILANSFSSVLSAFFQMRRRIGLDTLLNLGRDALQMALVVAAILLGYKLSGAITAVIISGLAVILIALILIFKQTGFHLPRFTNIKAYLKWGIPLTPNSVLMWIINVSDRYMVSYFLGISAAGIYSASYNIGQYASFALAPLANVLLPYISKTYDEGHPAETAKYLKYSLKYLMLIAIPAAFGLSMLAKPLLLILTTPEFAAGSAVVPWVAFGGVIFAFRMICNLGLYMTNKTRLSLALLVASAALNIILNLILIPRMGIIGAAVATFAAFGLLALLTLAITRKYFKFELSLPFIGKSILAAGVMALCIRWFNPASITSVIISITGGVIIYFGVLILIRGISRQEMNFFQGLIRNNLKGILKAK